MRSVSKKRWIIIDYKNKCIPGSPHLSVKLEFLGIMRLFDFFSLFSSRLYNQHKTIQQTTPQSRILSNHAYSPITHTLQSHILSNHTYSLISHTLQSHTLSNHTYHSDKHANSNPLTGAQEESWSNVKRRQRRRLWRRKE
jgi:hypothetical protein